MSLINCPECGKQVSSKAPACPGCGNPISPAPAPAPVKVVTQGGGGGGCGVFFFLLLAAGVAAFVTKPSEQDIQKAVVAKHGALFGIGAGLGQALGTAEYKYHDYFLFSTMTQKSNVVNVPERRLALGLFGQVVVSDL